MKTEQTLSTLMFSELDLNETSNSTFNKLVLKTVDEVLSSLGNNCKTAIYHYIETECAIPMAEIPNRAQEFSNALQNLFGTGAVLIEIEIMKRLSNRVPDFKFSPGKSSLSLKTYLSSLSSFL